MANVVLTPQDVFTGDNPMNQLLEELDSIFPMMLPVPTHSTNEIMYRSGQRSVVEYIKQKLEIENVSS